MAISLGIYQIFRHINADVVHQVYRGKEALTPGYFHWGYTLFSDKPICFFRPELPALAVRPQEAHVVRQHPQGGAEDLLGGGLQHATKRLDGDGESLV